MFDKTYFLFFVFTYLSGLFEDVAFWQSTDNISLNRENGDISSRPRNISETTSLTVSLVRSPCIVLNSRCFGFAKSNAGRFSCEMPKMSPYSGWHEAFTQR